VLNTLTELVIALFDLIEAEGRLLRRVAGLLCLSVVMFMAAGVLILAGLGMLLGGLYFLLEPSCGQAGALGISGGVCLMIGGGVIWFAARMLR
jgi:hypothetical protein